MKRKYIKYISATLLAFTLVSNLEYALLDYGMGSNSLGYQLVAQTNGATRGSGTGGSTSGGGTDESEFKYKATRDAPCTLTTAQGVTIDFSAVTILYSLGGNLRLGSQIDCEAAKAQYLASQPGSGTN